MKGRRWVTIEWCRCPRDLRHRFSRAGTLKGDPLFVAPCGRTVVLGKAPVGPWSYVPVPGSRREFRLDDAFPLRFGDSSIPAFRPPEVVPDFDPPTGKICPFCDSRGHWRICPIDPAFR